MNASCLACGPGRSGSGKRGWYTIRRVDAPFKTPNLAEISYEPSRSWAQSAFELLSLLGHWTADIFHTVKQVSGHLTSGLPYTKTIYLQSGISEPMSRA